LSSAQILDATVNLKLPTLQNTDGDPCILGVKCAQAAVFELAAAAAWARIIATS
jgi:hypothetical protein